MKNINEINFPNFTHYEKLPEQSLKMTTKEMEDLLSNIYNTPAWYAIRRYSDLRASIAEQTIQVVDPFKNPTDAARYQGLRWGLLDLQDYIIALNKKKDEKEEEEIK